jgi:hypothetical protein
MNLALKVIGVLLGSFAMVFGEFDDSPGLQGLGMILILVILFRVYKNMKADKQ